MHEREHDPAPRPDPAGNEDVTGDEDAAPRADAPGDEDAAGRRRAVIRAVGLVHFAAGRLLLVRAARQRSFYLPGGKIDPGETELEALRREVREELGGEVRAPRLLGRYRADAVGQGAGVQVELSCYAGQLRGEPRPAAEIAELAWMTRAEYRATAEPAPAVLAMWAERAP
ncbi:NUDIX hydrolase [Salinifilum aidingensis]